MLSNFKAYQISKEFYRRCRALRIPQILYDQLFRASSSIVLNLAEGSGRRTPADQRRHFAIAYASLLECRAILEMEGIDEQVITELSENLTAILYTLSRKDLQKTKKPPSEEAF